MDPIQAIILGAIQSLTEFLPISSSGHLILFSALFGWGAHGLAFDVALHVGTAAALLVHFRREWVQLAVAFVRGLRSSQGRTTFEWRLLWLLTLGALPASVAGFFFEAQIEGLLRSPIEVAELLIVFGILLFVAELRSSRTRSLPSLRWRDALLIGAAQVLALAPGVSRSGVTLTAALLLGFARPDGARFSFLLGTPLIVGAGILQLVGLARRGLPPGEALAYCLGAGAAAMVGVATIRGLLGYVQHHSLRVFVAYRLGLGGLVLASVAWLT